MHLQAAFFTMPKQLENSRDNADRYAYNFANNQAIIALADGVTQSFFPQDWALIITEYFVRKPLATIEQILNDCHEEWIAKINHQVELFGNYYSRRMLKEKRPAAATLVGLHIYAENDHWYWNSLVNGDSFLIFIPENNTLPDVIESSLDEPYIFDNFPPFLGSYNQQKLQLKVRTRESLTPGHFLLMSDACAEWFLNKDNNSFETIINWQTQEDFEKTITTLRQERKIKDDDTSLIRISISETENPSLNNQIICEPLNN